MVLQRWFWGYPRVIYQDSEIKGVGDNQIPSILILNLPKYCRHGLIKADIFQNTSPSKDSHIGIIFRYHDKDNFFSF